MNELCEHDRLTTGHCDPCAQKQADIEAACYAATAYVDPYDEQLNPFTASDRQVNGDHYKDMAVQPSEFIYRNALDWYEGNAVKYICRHKIKGGRVDVEKAIHYLELLLEAEYASAAENEE